MPTPQVAHRESWNRSRDSVCLNCGVTVADTRVIRSEVELEAVEAKHVCAKDPIDKLLEELVGN